MNENANIEWNKKRWGDKREWDEVFVGGYAWGGAEEVERWFRVHILPLIENKPSVEVLEIACGMGRFTQCVISHANVLHGIDICDICVNECRRRFAGENAKFSVTDGRTIPYGRFDLIVSYDSLVHADISVLRSYFSQFSSRLNVDGYAVIHHANWRDDSASRMMVTHEDVASIVNDSEDLVLVSQTLYRWVNPTIHDANGVPVEAEPRFIDCVSVVRRSCSGSNSESSVPFCSEEINSCDCGVTVPRNMNCSKGVWVWGAGSGGVRVTKVLKAHGVRVKGILDSDMAKCGLVVGGYRVESPSALQLRNECIVVATLFSSGVEEYLNREGMRRGENFETVDFVRLEKYELMNDL